jgi:hypothetical protein
MRNQQHFARMRIGSQVEHKETSSHNKKKKNLEFSSLKKKEKEKSVESIKQDVQSKMMQSFSIKQELTQPNQAMILPSSLERMVEYKEDGIKDQKHLKLIVN